MLHSGLVSITFRSLTPEQIIDLCVEAKIEGIEWGGDIHVPHGDIETATRVGSLTRAASIATPTYGSYYRVGKSEDDGLAFDQVLASAVALETPAIRVWAGSMDSADADEAEGFARDVGAHPALPGPGPAVGAHGTAPAVARSSRNPGS